MLGKESLRQLSFFCQINLKPNKIMKNPRGYKRVSDKYLSVFWRTSLSELIFRSTKERMIFKKNCSMFEKFNIEYLLHLLEILTLFSHKRFLAVDVVNNIFSGLKICFGLFLQNAEVKSFNSFKRKKRVSFCNVNIGKKQEDFFIPNSIFCSFNSNPKNVSSLFIMILHKFILSKTINFTIKNVWLNYFYCSDGFLKSLRHLSFSQQEQMR